MLIKRDFKGVFKDEEFRLYCGIVIVSMIAVTMNIRGMCASFGEALRRASFTVATIATTTGYSISDFNSWPALSKAVVALLALTGACAGSTAGGIKMVRVLALFKSARMELSKLAHPSAVRTVKINGRNIEPNVLTGIGAFVFAYAATAILATIVVSRDGMDLTSCGAAVFACLSNIGLGVPGSMRNFGEFDSFSKCALSFCMIAGRLEFFPAFAIFVPSVWKK
jgi:trk system potassium uptake protein TrkH